MFDSRHHCIPNAFFTHAKFDETALTLHDEKVDVVNTEANNLFAKICYSFWGELCPIHTQIGGHKFV